VKCKKNSQYLIDTQQQNASKHSINSNKIDTSESRVNSPSLIRVGNGTTFQWSNDSSPGHGPGHRILEEEGKGEAEEEKKHSSHVSRSVRDDRDEKPIALFSPRTSLEADFSAVAASQNSNSKVGFGPNWEQNLPVLDMDAMGLLAEQQEMINKLHREFPVRISMHACPCICQYVQVRFNPHALINSNMTF
jgi:hypothetical protein